MLDLAQLAAVPNEVKVGDKVYRLAPLNLTQIGKLEEWARDRIVDELPRKLRAIDKAKLEKSEAERLRSQIVSQNDRASRDPLELSKVMDSAAGQRLSFELSIRACQPVPDSELEAVCTAVGEERIRRLVAAALDSAARRESEDKAKAAPPDPPVAPANPSPVA